MLLSNCVWFTTTNMRNSTGIVLLLLLTADNLVCKDLLDVQDQIYQLLSYVIRSHYFHCLCGTSLHMIYKNFLFLHCGFFLCLSILFFYKDCFHSAANKKKCIFPIVNRSNFYRWKKNATSLSCTIAHISMSTNAFCPGDRRLLFRWMLGRKTTTTTKNKQTNKVKRQGMCSFFMKAIFKMIIKTDDYYGFV